MEGLKTALWLAAWFAVFLFCGATHAATRIALISGEGTASGDNVLDAATVELSKDAGLELLDRAEVNRVLREQQLSLAGLVGAEHAVKAGQLLHADLFAVLEGALTNESAATPAFGVVVFDARTGARHADTALAASNTMSTASAAAAVIRAAIEKSRQPPGNLQTVGLLLVRNADLPREFDSLCDSVGLLLERELTASPGIAVLERRRLEQVNLERRLPTGVSTNDLWSSLQMLELDIGREGEGLRGTLAIAKADGTRTNGITVSVAKRDAAALAHALVERLERLLNAPVGRVVTDRLAEARRFHRESVLSRQHRDYRAAIRALDAACALAPDEKSYAKELLTVLPDGAIELVQPGGPSGGFRNLRAPVAEALALSITWGHRNADLLTEACREVIANAKPGDAIPALLSLKGERQRFIEMIEKVSQVAANSEVARLAQKERVLRMEVIEPFIRARVTDRKSAARYGALLSEMFGGGIYFGSLAPEHLAGDGLLIARRWLEISRRFRVPDGTGDYAPFRWLTEPRNAPHFQEFWKELHADPDPVLGYYARLGMISATVPSRMYSTAKDETFELERDLRQFAERVLTQVASARQPRMRDQIWDVVEWGLQRIYGHPQAIQEYLESCRFAFAQQDVRPGLFDATVVRLRSSRSPKPPAEVLEVIDRALQMLRERPEAYPGITPEYYPTEEPALVQRAMAAAQRTRELMITELQKHRDQLAPSNLENAPSRPVLWQRATELLDFTTPTNQMGWFFKPVVAGESDYVAGVVFKDQAMPGNFMLQLMRVALDGSGVSLLGQTSAEGVGWSRSWDPGSLKPYRSDWANSFKTHSPPRLDFAQGACVGADCYFLATKGGVFMFPTNGGPVERLCVTNGLPTNDARSIAILDDKLYIGLYDEGRSGFLVAYDLRSHSLNVLASSRRSEPLSPFDNQPPFCPIYLLPDLGRGRLLVVNAGNSVPLNQITPVMGIWAYWPASKEFKQLASLLLSTTKRPLPGRIWAGSADANRLGINDGLFSLALFNVRNDELQILHDTVAAESDPALEPWRKRQRSADAVRGPFFLLDGWLWSSWPIQRTSLDGMKNEPLPSLRTDYLLQPTECLQLLEDGKRVLAGDQYNLWLLEFASDSGAARR